jgi:thiamine-phosphate pyrophosphorylase
LLAITDSTAFPIETIVSRVRELARRARPGSVAVLLRDHALPGRQRLEFGRRLGDVAREQGQKLWVADRLDLALLLAADGLHLGEASVPAAVARQLIGEELPVSRAFHASSLADVDQRELSQVDALVVSPVLAPRKGRAGLGPEVLATLGAQLKTAGHDVALFALGGVTAENAASCVAAGAHGVAAIGAALRGEPSALVNALGITR